MEIRQLKYFLMLAEELHFGKAAQKCFIEQPPLSRQIQKLEKELGVPLFIRDKRNVELTSFGKYLKEEAGKVIQQIQLIQNNISVLKEGTTGQIKIGYVGAAMHTILPMIISKLKDSYSDIYTILFEHTNENQINALRNGDIDIGFVRTPMDATDLRIEPIFVETFSLITPLTHRFAKKKKISLNEMAHESYIGFSHECAPGLADKIISICNRYGFSPKTTHVSTQINSILRLVESGLGYSIVPTSVKDGYSLKVKFFELIDVQERAELYLMYNPESQTPLLNNTIELIMSIMKNYKSK